MCSSVLCMIFYFAFTILCRKITSQIIMESCQYWVKLKFLDIRGLKSVSKKMFSTGLNFKWKPFCCSKVKNNCVSHIMRKCVQLDSIAMANCIHIADTSMLEIATYKPHFKHIDIKGCKKITDCSIISILNSKVELEFLDISATSVTDQG